MHPFTASHKLGLVYNCKIYCIEYKGQFPRLRESRNVQATSACRAPRSSKTTRQTPTGGSSTGRRAISISTSSQRIGNLSIYLFFAFLTISQTSAYVMYVCFVYQWNTLLRIRILIRLLMVFFGLISTRIHCNHNIPHILFLSLFLFYYSYTVSYTPNLLQDSCEKSSTTKWCRRQRLARHRAQGATEDGLCTTPLQAIIQKQSQQGCGW